MELTNEQIDAIAGKYHGMPIRRIVRECVAVAAEPEGRVGQWMFCTVSKTIHGPITESKGTHHCCANPWWVAEDTIKSNKVVRIPPPRAEWGDLTGWQCREPENNDPFHHFVTGKLCRAGTFVANAKHFGQRRWIPPQAAKPVFLDESAECPACGGGLRIVEDDDGRETNDVACDECGQIWPLVTVNAAALKKPRPQPIEHTCETCKFSANSGDDISCQQCLHKYIDHWTPKDDEPKAAVAVKPQPAERTCDTCRFEGLPDADPKCEQCFYPELHNWEPMPTKPEPPKKPIEHTCETCHDCGTPACDPPCNGCSRTYADLWRPKAETPTWRPVFPQGPFTVEADGNFFDVRRPDGEPVCGQCTKAEAEAIARALTGYGDAIAWFQEYKREGYYSPHSADIQLREMLEAAGEWDMGQDKRKENE